MFNEIKTTLEIVGADLLFIVGFLFTGLLILVYGFTLHFAFRKAIWTINKTFGQQEK